MEWIMDHANDTPAKTIKHILPHKHPQNKANRVSPQMYGQQYYINRA